MKQPSRLRAIPSVEKVVQALGDTGLLRAVAVDLVRREVAALRRAGGAPDHAAFLDRVRARIEGLRLSRLQPVINGTGIVLHTNLGRAPLGPAVLDRLLAVGGNYTNLELDLPSGERGGRAACLEHALALLCAAPAATVVNNCAAALVLILRHFTGGARKQVLISRGELVQIGGGFRIPEILESAGAVLREVGTTNRTTLADYTRAAGRGTALILRVHRSNFFMDGFTGSPAPEELAAWARRRRVPLVEDLGSGAVLDTAAVLGVEREPMVQEVLARGADLVCFSGDKLFGGVQAGIIAGAARRVNALKRDPFFRALRCDKLILGALEATVENHLRRGDRGHDEGELPVLALLRLPVEALRDRGERLVVALGDLPARVSLGAGRSQAGGGTLPRAAIPSVTLDLLPRELPLAELGRQLRQGHPPVIGYVSGGRFRLDLRTVFPRQDAELAGALRAVLMPPESAAGARR